MSFLIKLLLMGIPVPCFFKYFFPCIAGYSYLLKGEMPALKSGFT